VPAIWGRSLLIERASPQMNAPEAAYQATILQGATPAKLIVAASRHIFSFPAFRKIRRCITVTLSGNESQ
jgi:hypothetical protein